MDISSLVTLLVYLLVGGLIVYIVIWIIGMLTLPQPVKQVIYVLVAIVVLLWILRSLGFVAF